MRSMAAERVFGRVAVLSAHLLVAVALLVKLATVGVVRSRVAKALATLATVHVVAVVALAVLPLVPTLPSMAARLMESLLPSMPMSLPSSPTPDDALLARVNLRVVDRATGR